jgi:hypothetical protein
MNAASIFISHASSDNAFCHKLFDFLKHELPNSDIFYDDNELTAGDEWIRRIQHEVLKRPLFIVVLSPRSVVAEWVREETNLALSRSIIDKGKRRIIPIKIANCDVDLLAPLLTTRQIFGFSMLITAILAWASALFSVNKATPNPTPEGSTRRVFCQGIWQELSDTAAWIWNIAEMAGYEVNV